MTVDRHSYANSPIWGVVACLTETMTSICDTIGATHQALAASHPDPRVPLTLQIEVLQAREALLTQVMCEVVTACQRAHVESTAIAQKIEDSLDSMKN